MFILYILYIFYILYACEWMYLPICLAFYVSICLCNHLSTYLSIFLPGCVILCKYRTITLHYITLPTLRRQKLLHLFRSSKIMRQKMLAHLLPVSLPPFGLVQFTPCQVLECFLWGRVASELGTPGTGWESQKVEYVELFCQNRTLSTSESARSSGKSMSI